MEKFEIVKKYIDELDYYGLLAQGSPADEFDRESTIIAYQINKNMTAEDIAFIIADTFFEAFDGEDAEPAWFITTAEKILNELNS